MLEIKEKVLAVNIADAFAIWRASEESKNRKLLRKYVLLMMIRTKAGY
jgi:hypothetical protein